MIFKFLLLKQLCLLINNDLKFVNLLLIAWYYKFLLLGILNNKIFLYKYLLKGFTCAINILLKIFNVKFKLLILVQIVFK